MNTIEVKAELAEINAELSKFTICEEEWDEDFDSVKSRLLKIEREIQPTIEEVFKLVWEIRNNTGLQSGSYDELLQFVKSKIK